MPTVTLQDGELGGRGGMGLAKDDTAHLVADARSILVTPRVPIPSRLRSSQCHWSI
jgi:hypothetical protein